MFFVFSFFVKKKLDVSMFTGRNKGKWKRQRVYNWERTKTLQDLEGERMREKWRKGYGG